GGRSPPQRAARGVPPSRRATARRQDHCQSREAELEWAGPEQTRGGSRSCLGIAAGGHTLRGMGGSEIVYLDNAATTRLAPEVRDAMLPFLDGAFGNPSSMHSAGREARNAVDAARDRLAAALGCAHREIVFT